MSIVTYIGLGSNLGDRVANVRRALDALERSAACTGLRASALYESPPWGRSDQPPFVNAVAEVHTTLEPGPLLEELHRIEAEVGRRRAEEAGRWGPRVIDLDLLLYGAVVLRGQEGVVVPHRELHRRPFVLVPLCDLDAEVVHPVLGQPARELLEAVGDSQHVRRLDP